jgi:hypothetical protein
VSIFCYNTHLSLSVRRQFVLHNQLYSFLIFQIECNHFKGRVYSLFFTAVVKVCFVVIYKSKSNDEYHFISHKYSLSTYVLRSLISECKVQCITERMSLPSYCYLFSHSFLPILHLLSFAINKWFIKNHFTCFSPLWACLSGF